MDTVDLIFTNFLSALTPQINVALTIGVIAGIVGSSIGLVFMWWGCKYLVKVMLSGGLHGHLDVSPSTSSNGGYVLGSRETFENKELRDYYDEKYNFTPRS